MDCVLNLLAQLPNSKQCHSTTTTTTTTRTPPSRNRTIPLSIPLLALLEKKSTHVTFLLKFFACFIDHRFFPVLRHFLISGPTTLSPEELEDAKWREEADNAREGRKRFAKEIAARIDALRGAVKNVESDIMGEGMSYLKQDFVEDLT